MKDPNKNLTEIISSDTKELVYAKATYYGTFVRIWKPNQPYVHQKDGYENKTSQSSRLISDDYDPYETNEERSIRRTKKAIKDYSLMNDFDIFATFTIADDRYNDERSRKRLATWFKNQRTRNEKFKYIIVAERHKSGALHFHVLMGGYKGRLKYAINPNTGEYISDGRGDFVRNFDEFKLGFSTAKIISSKESKTKTAYYLQKYINKDMVIVFGKNRYWASKGLKRPKVEENPEEYYKLSEPNRQWVIDHGTVLEFDLGNNEIIDSFIKANQ